MLENSIKNEYKNLYLHFKLFNTNFKSNSYLVSLFCRHPVNPSTTFFPHINLTKTIRSLPVVLMSLKNGCNNLYYHPYTFDERYKSISYLTSLSRHSPVNPSSSTFGNINLTEAMTNLIVVWKFNQKCLQESLFAP